MSDEQPVLFELGPWWEEYWQGMPEYEIEDLRPWKTINVHFDDAESLQAFSKVVGQALTENTQWIWYPEAERATYTNKRYVDHES